MVYRMGCLCTSSVVGAVRLTSLVHFTSFFYRLFCSSLLAGMGKTPCALPLVQFLFAFIFTFDTRCPTFACHYLTLPLPILPGYIVHFTPTPTFLPPPRVLYCAPTFPLFIVIYYRFFTAHLFLACRFVALGFTSSRTPVWTYCICDFPIPYPTLPHYFNSSGWFSGLYIYMSLSSCCWTLVRWFWLFIYCAFCSVLARLTDFLPHLCLLLAGVS